MCRLSTKDGTRRGLFGGMPVGVPALAKFLDDLLVEGGNVVRLAAGDEALIDDDVAVDPFGAGIPEVGLERGPGRHPAAAHDVGLDQHPWAVTDRADRLLGGKELPHEVDRPLVGAQGVGIGDAAGQDEGVVFLSPDMVERPVDLDRVALLAVLHALDRAAMRRDDVDRGAGLQEGAARLGQFGLFETVGRHHRDHLSAKRLCHAISPPLLTSCPVNSTRRALGPRGFPTLPTRYLRAALASLRRSALSLMKPSASRWL